MKKFNSYQKIQESTDAWQVDARQMRQLQQMEWCVTEKIHGANFCFIVQDEDIQCAKRKAVLQQGEAFFNYEDVLSRYEDRILTVYESARDLLNRENPEIYIYGEMFGGEYPHPDIDPVPDVRPIQTGVYYAPGIEFCAFDLAIVEDGTTKVLDYRLAMDCFARADLHHVKPLFIGKMQEALNYSPRFETGIPAMLGLPSLGSGNIAEGVVIKPVKPVLVPTRKGEVRPILKNKIAEFAEDDRFHQGQNWSIQAHTTDHGSHAMPLLDQLEQEAASLLVENRLNNALSKTGYLSKANADEVIQELKQDVLEELESRHGSRWQELDQEDLALLAAVVEDMAVRLVQATLTGTGSAQQDGGNNV